MSTGLKSCTVKVTGVVQGVGFRPFVHGAATALGISGSVINRAGAVVIEAEGKPDVLDRFVAELVAKKPLLARIERVERTDRAVRGMRGFTIDPSRAGDGGILFAADVATCDECLAELGDRADRRFRYPFVNCTACGPRITIVTGAPYDRERTTMAGFAMCQECRAEYSNPLDRRFHAQPIACPSCGPAVALTDCHGQLIAGDWLEAAAELLERGSILAVKGLGGYHLATLASHDDAVAELRRRKQRDAKPLAIMVADIDAARAIVDLSDQHIAWLADPGRPIVLARRTRAGQLSRHVAPASDELGILLPYTPLHRLLIDAVGRMPLVMTSGNVSDEPIALGDQEARAHLAGIADAFVAHDRPIRTRCEDSVVRPMSGHTVWVRRSRGYCPLPLALNRPLARPTLAVGGHLKSVFAVGVGDRAILGPHHGDLDHLSAYQAFCDGIDHFLELFEVVPQRIVCDGHPDYASTRRAHELAEAFGAELVSVQHHRAHVASVMADRLVHGPVVGVAFDGAGYGDDGTVWGGELFAGHLDSLERMAHLAPIAQPGGDAAARQPWRMALAHLMAAGVSSSEVDLGRRVDGAVWRAVSELIAGGSQPMTSSVGRLFDAVSSLVGLCDEARFEGEAAMLLETHAARGHGDAGAYDMAFREHDQLRVLDPAPLIRAAHDDCQRGQTPAVVARRFHNGLARATASACAVLAGEVGTDTVILSGGVMVNAVLTEALTRELRRLGLRSLLPETVPPNDGGLALGQLALASAHDHRAARSH